MSSATAAAPPALTPSSSFRRPSFSSTLNSSRQSSRSRPLSRSRTRGNSPQSAYRSYRPQQAQEPPRSILRAPQSAAEIRTLNRSFSSGNLPAAAAAAADPDDEQDTRGNAPPPSRSSRAAEIAARYRAAAAARRVSSAQVKADESGEVQQVDNYESDDADESAHQEQQYSVRFARSPELQGKGSYRRTRTLTSSPSSVTATATVNAGSSPARAKGAPTRSPSQRSAPTKRRSLSPTSSSPASSPADSPASSPASSPKQSPAAAPPARPTRNTTVSPGFTRKPLRRYGTMNNVAEVFYGNDGGPPAPQPMLQQQSARPGSRRAMRDDGFAGNNNRVFAQHGDRAEQSALGNFLDAYNNNSSTGSTAKTLFGSSGTSPIPRAMRGPGRTGSPSPGPASRISASRTGALQNGSRRASDIAAADRSMSPMLAGARARSGSASGRNSASPAPQKEGPSAGTTLRRPSGHSSSGSAPGTPRQGSFLNRSPARRGGAMSTTSTTVNAAANGPSSGQFGSLGNRASRVGGVPRTRSSSNMSGTGAYGSSMTMAVEVWREQVGVTQGVPAIEAVPVEIEEEDEGGVVEDDQLGGSGARGGVELPVNVLQLRMSRMHLQRQMESLLASSDGAAQADRLAAGRSRS